MPELCENRLFTGDSANRCLARDLFGSIEDAPIVSPHGHTDPQWFSENRPFENPAELFVTPDHYVFRMLHSQGVSLDDLGVPRADGRRSAVDPREVWRIFASHSYLFRATPSKMWMDYSLQEVFGINKPLSAETSDEVFDEISESLTKPEFRPRALFDQFNIEVIATTESPLDTLEHHASIASSVWSGRVITTYRPDAVIDPETGNFQQNLQGFSEITGEDALSWPGYLEAHRKRRGEFISHGATASDHGHPTARTDNLSQQDAEALFRKVVTGQFSTGEAETFRAHMLTEMAKMSLDDGLVMQIHPGSFRNHSQEVFGQFGADKGFDIPRRTDYVDALHPLLNLVGNDPGFSLIIFSLDESTYGRELAPLAGVYPSLKLGPAWWFFDSPDGMRRFRELTTETAGFYNTVGFNDDTRAFCSIPARHDMARRVDANYLASLVTTGRLGEADAYEVIQDLTHRLAKRAYRL